MAGKGSTFTPPGIPDAELTEHTLPINTSLAGRDEDAINPEHDPLPLG